MDHSNELNELAVKILALAVTALVVFGALVFWGAIPQCRYQWLSFAVVVISFIVYLEDMEQAAGALFFTAAGVCLIDYMAHTHVME